MPDPFFVEKEFQTLRQRLGLFVTRKNKLFAIVEFVQRHLQPQNNSFITAYAVELAPILVHTAMETDFVGVPPQLLSDLRKCFIVMEPFIDDDARVGGWSDARAHVERAQKRTESDIRLKERAPSTNDGGHSSAWIPLVETEHGVSDPPRFATIRKLRVEVTARRGELQNDRIEFSGILDRRNEEGNETIPVINAAKLMYRVHTGKEYPGPIMVRCGIDGEGILWGDSLELAAAILVFAGLLRRQLHRDVFIAPSDVAFTGRMASDGRVLPVDPSGLHLKVLACAYSRIRRLVVPAEQVLAAKKHIDDLHIRDEGVILEILGTGSLEEAMTSRKMTVARRVGIVRNVLRKAIRYRRFVVAAIVVAMLFTIIRLACG